jgi:hypothetical protein
VPVHSSLFFFAKASQKPASNHRQACRDGLLFAGSGGFAAGFVFGRWFRNVETFRYGFKGFSKFNARSQDKGHEIQFAKYMNLSQNNF